ncbi:MAG: hypothetical protein ABIA97_05195 [Candidatus Omnitrophota bacterium]
MKVVFVLMLAISILFPISNYSYAQHEEVTEKAEILEEAGEEIQEEAREVTREAMQGRIPVIREAKIFRNKNVAVDAHLVDGEVLEIMVEARIYAQKPRINDVLVSGPKLGKERYIARKTIVAGVDEPEPFEVTKEHGWVVFGKRKKVRELEGTLTKELFKIKIPKDKVVCGKKYQLWVEIESKTEGGRAEKFKFKLKDFPSLFHEDCLPQDK